MRVYEIFRERVLPRYLGMSHAKEMALASERIGLAAGGVVVDLACGQGNFSLDFARRVGPDGLVIGIDVARAMLERAASRRERAGVSNLALVRGDALDLPLRTRTIRKLYCSGGLHQFPDLEQAIGEVARVCAPGARVAMSGFARAPESPETRLGRIFQRGEMQVVSLGELSEMLKRLGFADLQWTMSRFALGHLWARMAN